MHHLNVLYYMQFLQITGLCRLKCVVLAMILINGTVPRDFILPGFFFNLGLVSKQYSVGLADAVAGRRRCTQNVRLKRRL
jgi:hypothetical protein